MSKNILFFISSLNGGAENQLYKLFELLKDENEARYVVAKAENSNSNVIGLNKKKTIFAISGLIKEIIKLKPDILFTTLPTPNFLNVLIKKISFFKYKSICRVANYNINLKTTNFIVKNSDIVYFNSVENFNIYADMFPKYKNKFVYLNNIINPYNENVDKPSLRPRVRALIASRLVHNKGIDMAIKAMNEIDNDNISLDIYGEGPEANSLKTMSTNPNTVFKGYTNYLNDHWKSYNLFLLPSRQEGMSNSLLEAQLNNIYSIVSNCKTGNEEIINLTENGACFDTGDYQDLKKSIINFYKNESLTKYSRQIIVENFSDTNAKSILKKTLNI